MDRTVDAYRHVSINNRLLPANKANPDDVQQLKTADLPGLQF